MKCYAYLESLTSSDYMIAGTGKTLTARVIDTAGNVTALPLSDNSYTLDTGNPLVTLSTITDTKNTGNVSVQSSAD